VQSSTVTVTTEVFEAETQAYEIASRSDQLKEITPGCFGKCETLMIIDGAGNDVSGEFQLGLAFEAEFVDGQFVKSIAAGEIERERVNRLFWKHKIFHTIDMSICMKDGKIAKAIDFTMKEIELWAT
jgi:hypothetical protein